MSLESGGRADKYGNQYENRYLAKLLLRLINEEIVSVEVEPLGIEGEGVEFISTDVHGNQNYYQCKASNTTHSSWAMSDLQRHDVFNRSKRHIESGDQKYYYFISPLQYGELDELCKRARTNSSAQDFLTYQINNPKIKAVFSECEKHYSLDRNNPQELKNLIYILAHCYFEHYSIGEEERRDLEGRIGTIFTGKTSTIRNLLEQYANDTGSFGIKITAKDVIAFITERHGISVRNYHHDNRVLNRVTTLNEIYWGTFKAINNQLIHRKETDFTINQIMQGNSLIMHGKAGVGKSGCIQEIMEFLQKSQILYLGIKLDKFVPNTSADEFGQKLGLPESPIYCLHTLSAGKNCVLILDQLDALRWIERHSAVALDVCKEMISQANDINKYENGKISVIFVSRTFDLENDRGLQSLFSNMKNDSNYFWKKVEVGLLCDSDVKTVVGSEYNTLSTRLRVLLRTPSSLYVWSHLNKQERKNPITSVNQLMQIWWKQILENCTIDNHLSETEVTECKNNIVTKMNDNAVFVLPYMLFENKQKVINLLISEGLLVRNENTIAFTHQSFLDYFIAYNALRDIYSGIELTDILGVRDNQTPKLRYQLLIILQTLLDSDKNMFLKHCKTMLVSDTIRHYFKCAVFETIGQCEAPNEAIHVFTESYLVKEEWHNYIIQTVYYGHPEFIIRLDMVPSYNWFGGEGLFLLKSIQYQDPDFVTEKLYPYGCCNLRDDKKIFNTLCGDLKGDSEKMFEFRVKLLRHSPEIFRDFKSLVFLKNCPALRAVQLMKIIIQNKIAHEFQDVIFRDENDTKSFVTSNYMLFVNELFIEICKETPAFSAERLSLEYWNKYKSWFPHVHQESCARTIVELMKMAFAEFAKRDPVGMLLFLKNKDYPKSVVGNEIIMYAIGELPTTSSDDAIEWLLSDFRYRVFVYTSEKDNLKYTKHIIQKFSSVCKIELFQELEEKICSWKDDIKGMVEIYRYRLKVDKEHPLDAMYYTYWGHFQKELLPYMDNARLSSYAKDLLNVLNRNYYIQTANYHSGILSGPMKAVSSPVSMYADRLSDKTWLNIIKTPNEKMKDFSRGKETDECYIEASHFSFANTFSRQAKKEPLRFAKLSLSFPKECYSGYICGVLNALMEYSNEGCTIDMRLVIEVIRYYRHTSSHSVGIAITNLIEKYADQEWPQDIFDILSGFALEFSDPEYNLYESKNNKKSFNYSPQDLYNASISNVNGCALWAIAALISEHPELESKFKPIIISASENSHDLVRMAVMQSVLVYYNIDSDFSVRIFKKIISEDLRIIGIPATWNILSREYPYNSDFYREKIISACKSNFKELANEAAKQSCAIAIYFNDTQMQNFVMAYQYKMEQVSKVCRQAISSFNKEEFHNLSEKILVHFIDKYVDEINELRWIFSEIELPRDKRFLMYLMNSNQGKYLIADFIEYLNEKVIDIVQFADILKTVGDRISLLEAGQVKSLNINNFIHCIIRLFDKGQNDSSIKNICLDIWDSLYKVNHQDVRFIFNMIDNE